MHCKFVPGVDLLVDVRAGFVRQHSSLARYCRENGLTAAWARQVLVGKRKGPSATKTRNLIADAAGVAPRRKTIK